MRLDEKGIARRLDIQRQSLLATKARDRFEKWRTQVSELAIADATNRAQRIGRAGYDARHLTQCRVAKKDISRDTTLTGQPAPQRTQPIEQRGIGG